MRLLSRELGAWRPADLTVGVSRLGKRELTAEVAEELSGCGARLLVRPPAPAVAMCAALSAAPGWRRRTPT